MIDGRAVVFTDVPQSAWFSTYVRDAAELGIVNGYKDRYGRLTGRFKPENNITVAEALKIAVEGAGYDEARYGALVESGIASHWASPYVSVAKSEDFSLFLGHVRVDRLATRAEVASLFTSAFRIDVSDVSPVDTRYSDVDVDTDYAASVEVLSRDGVVSGDTDVEGELTGTFRPTDLINRAEVVKMVMEARLKYGTPGEGREPSQNNDVHNMTIRYDEDGFTPTVLRVKLGATVTFRNDSTERLQIASNPHPTHTDYRLFNDTRARLQGESFVFTFNRLGSFGYHNHLHPSMGGTIVVEE